jgi:hypothetical protein
LQRSSIYEKWNRRFPSMKKLEDKNYNIIQWNGRMISCLFVFSFIYLDPYETFIFFYFIIMLNVFDTSVFNFFPKKNLFFFYYPMIKSVWMMEKKGVTHIFFLLFVFHYTISISLVCFCVLIAVVQNDLEVEISSFI